MSHVINRTQEQEDCVQDCLDCYRACTETLRHCMKMGEKHLEESHLRLLQDCAQLCKLSADFILRGSDAQAELCRVCADVCRRCAESCEQVDPSDEQMAHCADVCRQCAVSCMKMRSHL